MKKIVTHALLILAIFVSIGAAQSQYPVQDELTDLIKSEIFSVGALNQVVYEYQSSDPNLNSFSIATTRLNFRGKLDGDFSYYLQFDFTKSPSVLDAFMAYTPRPWLGVKVGAFKSPFSREYLTSAAKIDFVNRSFAVNAFAPKRQIGFEVYGWVVPNRLKYQAGVFNGDGITKNYNMNTKMMKAGRLSFYPQLSDKINLFELGVNGVVNDQSSSYLPDPGSFTQSAAFGADVRIEIEKGFFAAELLSASLENQKNDQKDGSGYQVTGAYNANSILQLLLRFESLTPMGSDEAMQWVIPGLNLNPTPAAGFQVNYVIPVSGENKSGTLLVNFQIVL